MASRAHIYLSSNFWNGLWIIQQPIASEIAKTEPLLYVERFVSVFTVLRYPRLWHRFFTWLRGARRVSPRLRLLAPLPLFHLGHRYPWLFRLEFTIQRLWILWWARLDAASQRVLWLDNPLYECGVGRMRETLAVYHVADEVTAFPTSHARVYERLERQTLDKVDVVFAAAEQLAEDKRRWNPRTHTVWNAINADVFSSGLDAAFDAVDRIPAPRVAFIGVLDQWVDVELLRLVAQGLQDVHLVVVGPSRVDDRALRALPNVHFFGRQSRDVVPRILQRCSASVVPFRKTRLTERIVPLKIFEALAAGILPVCTDFSPDLDQLERAGYARVGRTAEEFAEAVRAAVASDTPSTRARLSGFGKQQTWEARWGQMRSVLDQARALPVEHG